MTQPETPAQRPPLDRRLVTILLIVFVQLLGASMALPILPLFARREFDLSPAAITPILATFFAAQFVAGPFIGRLSDQYGRVPVLIVSQIGTVISFLMLVFAQSVPMLYASRLLDGITGGNIVVAQAYVTDITPRERRTQSLGLIFAAFGVGFTFGPALGGLLSSLFGVRTPFLFAALAAAVVVGLTWRNLDETLSPEQRATNRQRGSRRLTAADVLGNVPLLTVLGIVFVAQLALGLVQATFALFGEAVLFAGQSEQATDLGIGLLLAVVGLGQVFTQVVLLERMIRRFGERWLIVIGNTLRMLGLMGLALALSPWVAAPTVALFAMGSGLLLPSLQSTLTLTVDDSVRGAALGLFQSIVSLAIIVSTAAGGQIFDVDPALPFWLGAGLAFLVTLPALWIVRWSAAHTTTEAADQADALRSGGR